MKTIFSRLFSMIAALLMLCLLITGVAFRFLMMSWVESEKRKSLSADASALADLAEAYDSAGELESNWNFQIGLSLFSEVGEVGAMICDEDGYVVICSCDNLTCDHVGKQVPESYRRVLELKCVEEESNREIARRLGLKESTVATRVLRGRTMLAAAPEKEDTPGVTS